MKIQFAMYLVTALASAQQAGEASVLNRGYRDMYNLQFDDAHHLFGQWEQDHPDDPMGPVSQAAAYLFSEFDRLKILQTDLFVGNESFFQMRNAAADPEVKQRFEEAIGRTERLSNRILKSSPQDDRAQFANVLRLGLHADYLALIEKRYMASLGEMKTARMLAEVLVAEHPELYDAQLAVGVENYLLSQKPAPVRWVLRMTGAQADKGLGIDRLRLTAEKGHYLLPYAHLLLAVAALRDKDTERAADARLAYARVPYQQLVSRGTRKITMKSTKES